MSAVTRFLFRSPYTCRTPLQIVAWWESRRPVYNAVVGTAGLITFGVVHLMAILPPHALPLPLFPSLAVAGVYGVMANAGYTLGWIAELLLRRRGGDELEAVGAAIFRYGLVFSIGLTLFPIAVMSLAKMMFLISAIVD
jgi:hypothetical protein